MNAKAVRLHLTVPRWVGPAGPRTPGRECGGLRRRWAPPPWS